MGVHPVIDLWHSVISGGGRCVAFTSYTITNPFGSRTDAVLAGPLR